MLARLKTEKSFFDILFRDVWFRPGFQFFEWGPHYLFGPSPILGHTLHTFIHIINGVLVYKLARVRYTPTVSALAAILFLAHPRTIESTAWLSGTGLYPTLFALITLVWRRPAVILTGTFLALSCKESWLGLPLIHMMLHTWYDSTAKIKPKLKPFLFSTAGVALYFIARFLLTLDFTKTGYGAAKFIEGAGNAIPNLFRIGGSLVTVPVLGVVPFPIIDTINISLMAQFFIFNAPLVIFIGVLFAYGLRKLPPFLPIALFASIIPVLTLGTCLLDTQQGRYLYGPAIFLALALPAGALSRRYGRAGWIIKLMVIVAFVFSFARMPLSMQWRHAGKTGEAWIQNALAQKTEFPVRPLVLPDSINGAFILRGHANAALALYNPELYEDLDPKHHGALAPAMVYLHKPDALSHMNIDTRDGLRISPKDPSRKNQPYYILGIGSSEKNTDISITPHGTENKLLVWW